MKVEPKDCGMGEGAKCCSYLVCGPNGFECGREISFVKETMARRALAGTSNARRLPVLPFPQCQQESLQT